MIKKVEYSFNTQPPEGGWCPICGKLKAAKVSTHSRPKAAGQKSGVQSQTWSVSTHSRPKAAGLRRKRQSLWIFGFNTQPPEGGWQIPRGNQKAWQCFNTQPPEGGWVEYTTTKILLWVSTHSRPKAAGPPSISALLKLPVSTHSRPKAAGNAARAMPSSAGVSTHSRPKAAAASSCTPLPKTLFQHTAARRWLLGLLRK